MAIENIVKEVVFEMCEIFSGMSTDEAESLKYRWIEDLKNNRFPSKTVMFINKIADAVIKQVTYL